MLLFYIFVVATNVLLLLPFIIVEYDFIFVFFLIFKSTYCFYVCWSVNVVQTLLFLLFIVVAFVDLLCSLFIFKHFIHYYF